MTHSDTQTPVFVVSSGRAGSTLLARMIQAHPELLCVSDLLEPVGEEPYFDRARTVEGGEFFRILSRPSYPQRIAFWRRQPTTELLYLPEDDELVSLLLTYTLPFLAGREPMALFHEARRAVESFPEGSMADQLIRFFDWLRDRFGKRLWLERTGGSLPHTRKIIETWPHARIVHNYRDLRETAISMLTGSFFRLYLELSKDPELGEWDWSRYPPVEELGAMLNGWVVDAVAAISRLPADQTFDVSYEDLVSEPESTLLGFSGFVLQRSEPSPADLEWARAQARIVRRVPLRFPDLDPHERQRLEDSCREGLEALGYPLSAPARCRSIK